MTESLRLDGHVIAPGVRGWLENPPADVIAPDCLFVSGWAFASGAGVVGAWLTGAALLASRYLPVAAQPVRPVNDPTDRKIAARTARAFLDSFLASGARLRLPASDRPVVSVVLVLWNRAELTFNCLRSLLAQTEVPMEVVAVDNASTDETKQLLSRVDGITVV